MATWWKMVSVGFFSLFVLSVLFVESEEAMRVMATGNIILMSVYAVGAVLLDAIDNIRDRREG